MAQRKAFNPLLKSYPDSEKINRVSEGAEVLYVRLLAASDDYHHYYADPARVAHKLFTERMLAGQATVEGVAARLDELARVDLIRLYESDGKQYLEIVHCFKKFRSDVRRVARFPMPPASPIPPPIRDRPAHVTDAVRDCPANGSSTQPNPTQPNPTQPKRTKKPSKNPVDEITYPDGLDTPQVREAVAEWLQYKRGRGDTYKKPAHQMGLLLKQDWVTDAATFIAGVRHSIAQNYKGCFPASRVQDKTTADPRGTQAAMAKFLGGKK
jgi:hypothetical protein